MQELLKNKTAVVLSLLLLILAIINVITFRKTAAINTSFKQEQKSIRQFTKDLKAEKKQLKANLKEEKANEKAIIAEKTNIEQAIKYSEALTLEIDQLIEKSNTLGDKHLEDFIDKKEQKLSTDDMVSYASLATGKSLAKKDYKGYTAFTDSEGFLTGNKESYYFSILNGNTYVTLLVTTEDGEVQGFYIINQETKKVELEREYQNVKVAIEHD